MPWADLIRNNFLLKMFSLALAILIWLAVTSSLQSEGGFTWNPWMKEKTRRFHVPVSLLIQPTQGQVFSVSPSNATIVVRGYPPDIEELSASDILAFAKVDDAKSPMGTFPVDTKLPGDLTRVSVTPQRVSVVSEPEPFILFPASPLQ